MNGITFSLLAFGGYLTGIAIGLALYEKWRSGR